MCQEHVPESGTADKKKAINQVHADLFRLTYHDCHMKARQLLPGLMPGIVVQLSRQKSKLFIMN